MLILEILERIERSQHHILKRLEITMATQADISADIDQANAALSQLTTEIVALKDLIAAGGTISQELKDKADALVARVQNLVVTAQPPTP